MCVCAYVRMCVCVHVRMCVCVYVYVCVIESCKDGLAYSHSICIVHETGGSRDTSHSEVTGLLQSCVARRMPLSFGPTNERLQCSDSVAVKEGEG